MHHYVATTQVYEFSREYHISYHVCPVMFIKLGMFPYIDKNLASYILRKWIALTWLHVFTC